MQWLSAPNIAGAPLPQRARGYWGTHLEAVREAVEAFLERERGQLPPWAVVGFGTGIAGWFALDGPGEWAALMCLCAAAAVFGFTWTAGRLERAIGWFGLAAAIGCALVWLRSEQVAAPRLERPLIASFEAEIEKVETLAAKGDLRLTLAPTDPSIPPRVRVSIKESTAPAGLGEGARLQLRARLAPPPAMALPGTYDFARDAWFRGIGAVGRALGPVIVVEPVEPAGLASIRDRLSRHVREQLPGSSGTIANALATGDQNAISKEDAEAMRRSGLAHLLSVSGLHIAAVVGAAMLLTMKLLALSERLALRFNLLLVAAGVGALAGIGYTLLTGMQVPTVRSCIAALLVLVGIALGRDAISLRLIAVGALIVLTIRPEAIAGASFQFSFAAVTSIVALHSAGWARRLFHRREEGRVAGFLRAVGAMIATGLVVEIALMPFALFHFHKAGLYGVAANLIAIPLTTFVVMPLEAGALLLDAIGLGAPLWFLAGVSLDFLLAVAHLVANAPGAVTTLASMPVWSFVLMVAGSLWLCLWTSRPRLFGLIPFAIGAAGAALAPVPDLLVTGDGRHLAVTGDDGTPLILRGRSGDFIRDVLSEAAGSDSDPEPLASAAFASCSRDACIALINRGGRRWRLLATRSSVPIDYLPLVKACAQADIVVSDRWLPRGCVPRWLKLDRRSLTRTGGVALYLRDRPHIRTVAERVGTHPWAMGKSIGTSYKGASPDGRFACRNSSSNAKCRARDRSGKTI